MRPIITSLLDTDLYSLTMLQAVIHHYPSASVRYRLKSRNGFIKPRLVSSEDFMERLNEQIDALCSLSFSKEELDYLSHIRFFKPDFISYLRNLKLHKDCLTIKMDERGEDITMKIEGSWPDTILFPVPLSSILSELHHEMSGLMDAEIMSDGQEHLDEMILDLHHFVSVAGKVRNFSISDFGTRRRFSAAWQRKVVERFVQEFSGTGHRSPGLFSGTSNVLLAKEIGIVPIGTMAHEFLQAHQQLGMCRVEDSQSAALDAWAREYRGELGIALSDVVGFDAFLRDFDLYFAKLFDGCRHDSGSPYIWGNKLIEHYQQLRIDPMTKTAVFSDGLNIKTATQLYEAFASEIKVACGIGTELTNNLSPKKYTPLQIVIKLVEVNGRPVAKISDSPGKEMCEDPQYVEYVKRVFKIKGR